MEETQADEVKEENIEVSNAISGTRGAQTMQVVGYVRNLSLEVL